MCNILETQKEGNFWPSGGLLCLCAMLGGVQSSFNSTHEIAQFLVGNGKLRSPTIRCFLISVVMQVAINFRGFLMDKTTS